jgi:hypothetical protein
MSEKKFGSVDIQLSKPIKVGGAEVAALRMREPTVADQMAMDKVSGSDAERELVLVANLCLVAPSDLHQLTLRDYKKVQAALVAFTD